MSDHVFPEDGGTGAPEGDFMDAANFASYTQHDILSDYKAEGLDITVDFSIPSFDISDGKCFVKDESAFTIQSPEERSYGVVYVVEIDSRTNIELDDEALNEVFLNIDLTVDDSVNIVVGRSDPSLNEPYLKLAEIDTVNDTLNQSFSSSLRDSIDIELDGDIEISGTLTEGSAL